MRDHPPCPRQIAKAEAEDADALAARLRQHDELTRPEAAGPRRFWFGWCLAIVAAWVTAACFLF